MTIIIITTTMIMMIMIIMIIIIIIIITINAAGLSTCFQNIGALKANYSYRRQLHLHL